ncbi:hypothetical protein AHAS_Ahas09G0038500 [Arachis hypogaea]
MKAHRSLPDRYTYSFVIKAYSSMCRSCEGKLLHGSTLRCGVDMYEKCGKIDDARKVFDGMSEKNVGDIMEAKRLFDEMPQKNMEDLGNVRVVLDAMPEKSVTFFTIMIDGYAKAGDMATSRFLFDQVPEKDVGDTYTYKVAASFEKSLQGFEHVYDDIVSGVIDVNELGFLVKHMECMVRKMDRYLSITTNLYSEMEVLNQ